MGSRGRVSRVRSSAVGKPRGTEWKIMDLFWSMVGWRVGGLWLCGVMVMGKVFIGRYLSTDGGIKGLRSGG